MRKTFALTLITLAAAVPLLAKSKDPVGDWQTVQQDIPRGWRIAVVTSMTFPCNFERASADELICAPIGERGESDDALIHVRRDRIREIRADKREGANMLTGAGGGAGLGILLGSLLMPGLRAPALLGFSGGALGAHSGRETHTLRGKVIYRRPIDDHASPNDAPAGTDVNKNISNDEQTVQPAAPAWYAIVRTLP